MDEWKETLTIMSSKTAVLKDKDKNISISEIGRRICNLHHHSAVMWSSCGGWAPENAAKILSMARLDRQTSLAVTLRRWLHAGDDYNDGDLIIAWTNLGALLEGTLKLFLCVYHTDYLADEDNLKKTQAYHAKKQKPLDPDGLRLDVLIQYCEVANLLHETDLALAKLVQSRRNAIHAFKDRDLGTWSDFWEAVRDYRLSLRAILWRLPYPDRQYEPTEIDGPY